MPPPPLPHTQQIAMLMFLYKLYFWTQFLYVADFVIVYGALLLETSHWHHWFVVQGGGLFAILLFWRIVRVVHGLATSVEMHHAKLDAKVRASPPPQHTHTHTHTHVHDRPPHRLPTTATKSTS